MWRLNRQIVLAFVLAAVLTGVALGGELDIQGHRGCRGLAPENSIPAFEKAIALGVTTLELDVQMTRDRVLVAHHDPRLDPERCRRDDGAKLRRDAIGALELADLASVRCAGASIPRFEQVIELALAAPYPVRLSVEIKAPDEHAGISIAEIADRLIEALRARDALARSTVQSFDAAALRAVALRAPEVPRAILVSERVHYDRALEESGATILSPKHSALLREEVVRMHARGIRVIPWTVNEPADIDRMLDWGVDGMISDYPDRVIAAVARRFQGAPGSPRSRGRESRWPESDSSSRVAGFGQPARTRRPSRAPASPERRGVPIPQTRAARSCSRAPRMLVGTSSGRESRMARASPLPAQRTPARTRRWRLSSSLVGSAEETLVRRATGTPRSSTWTSPPRRTWRR